MQKKELFEQIKVGDIVKFDWGKNFSVVLISKIRKYGYPEFEIYQFYGIKNREYFSTHAFDKFYNIEILG